MKMKTKPSTIERQGVTSKPEQVRRRFLRWGIACLLVILMLCLSDALLFPYNSPIAAQPFKSAGNGIWIRYTWYFGGKTHQDFEHLSHELNEHQIRYACFHVRSINKQGQLVYHKAAEGRALTEAMHRFAPGVTTVAWVYADNTADLAKPQIRRSMVAEALWLTTVCGFDGVQWDYETSADGDQNFLSLLKETRAALPKGKQISVAAPIWLPEPLKRWSWSPAYYRRVAQHCDQMYIMCYDTGFVHPRSYVWLARKQPEVVCKALAGTGCKVVFGLPAYGAGLRSHNPRAESLDNGIRGIREGIDALPPEQRATVDGSAPFAEYTMDKARWKAWDTLWLSKDSRKDGAK